MIKTHLLTSIVLFFFLLWSSWISIPSNAVLTASTLPHKTDFLNLPICGDNTWCGTTWYPMHSASERAAYRQQMNDKGYTHVYLSIASRRYDYFGKVNGAAEFRALLEEIVNDGLKPVVFLTSDTDRTTGNWSQQSIGAIQSDLSSFIPQIDTLVNSYVLGIEIDEYWKYRTDCGGVKKTAADCVGEHLDTLTSKPLAAHQYPGRWDLCTDWCDYMVLQTNDPARPTTAREVRNTIIKARNGLNKPVVAGEYNLGNEKVSISLGTAAQEVCSAGFGNGGNPSSIIWPNCRDDEITPTPEKNITLTLTPTPTQKPTIEPVNIPTKTGDANRDGKVDIEDYTIWLRNVGSNTTGGATKGDFNQDQVVDRQDYLTWLSNYSK